MIHLLSLKLFIIVGRHPASFKIGISKVQDLGNFEVSPMYSLTDYCAILFQVAAFKKKFAGV